MSVVSFLVHCHVKRMWQPQTNKQTKTSMEIIMSKTNENLREKTLNDKFWPAKKKQNEKEHFSPKINENNLSIYGWFMIDKDISTTKNKKQRKKYWYWNRYLDSVEGKKRSNYSLDLRHISFFCLFVTKVSGKFFFQNIIGWHFYHHHYRLLDEFDL